MNTKTTAILALVCVAVFAYLFLVVKPFEQKPKGEDAGAKKAEKALIDPKPEGTDRVEVNRRDGKSFVFVRDGKEDWKLAAPILSPASKFEVDALVEAIASLKIDKEYAKDSSERPGPNVSGLDKPNTVKLMKGDKVQAEVKVGSPVPTGRGNYVQLGGADKIGISKTDLSSHFSKRIEDYRDKRVLKFEYADVQRVKAEGVRNYELVKGAGETWTMESPVRAQADKAKVDGMVRPLTNLRADQFVDDAPETPKLYGLDKPRLTLAVETRKTIEPKAKPGDPDTQPADTQPSVESNTYVLLVGGAADPGEESYFAQVAGSPSVFTIRQDTFKSLSPADIDIRDKMIARVEVEAVRKIEATTPDGEMVLTRDADRKWRFADNTEADATLAGDLVKAVSNLQVTDFVDPTKELLVLDWDRPRAKIVLTQEGQVNPVTLLVGPASASGKMAYVRNPAMEGVAAVAEAAVTQLLQPPVSYRNRNVLTFPREDAAEILIDRADSQAIAASRHVILAKRDNVWSMVAPVSGPADEEAVRNLLQDLSSLPAKRVVAVGEKEKYGLDKPGVVVTVTMKSADAAEAGEAAMASTLPATGPARDVAVLNQLIEYQKNNPNENPKATEMLKKMLAEKTASMPAETAESVPAKAVGKAYMIQMTLKDGKVHACVPDSDVVYELDNKVYEDAVAEMYRREVFTLEPGDVTELAFKTGASTVTLRKTGDIWKYLEDPLVQIDASKVTDVLSAYKEFKTFRYAEYAAEDLGKYGLTADADGVTFGLKDGRKIELLVSTLMGPAGDATQSLRYAVLAGTNRVFMLKPDQVARTRQRLEDLQKR